DLLAVGILQSRDDRGRRGRNHWSSLRGLFQLYGQGELTRRTFETFVAFQLMQLVVQICHFASRLTGRCTSVAHLSPPLSPSSKALHAGKTILGGPGVWSKAEAGNKRCPNGQLGPQCPLTPRSPDPSVAPTAEAPLLCHSRPHGRESDKRSGPGKAQP